MLGATLEPARTDRLGDPIPRGALARIGTARFQCRQDVFALAYSADGTKLAAGCRDGSVRVFAARHGQLLATLATGALVSRLAFSEDGQLLTTVDETNAVRLWNTLTNTCVKTIALEREHPAGVLSLTWRSGSAFAPSGQRVAVATRPCIVAIVDLVEGRVLREIRVAPDLYTEEVAEKVVPTVFALSFTACGRTLFAATADGKLRSFDVVTGKKIVEVTLPAVVLAAGPDGVAAVERVSGRVHRYSEDGRSLGRSAIEGVRTATYGPRGGVLACVRDGFVDLLDAQGELLRTVRIADAGPVALAPDGVTLAAACGATIRTFAIESGRELTRHAPPIVSLVFAPDSGHLLCGSTDGSVSFFEPESGEPVRRIEGHTGSVLSVDVSRAGDVASVDEEGLVLIREPEGRSLVRLERPNGGGRARKLAFSPDGNLLALAGVNQIYDQAAEQMRELPLTFLASDVVWKKSRLAAVSGEIVMLNGRRPERVGVGCAVAFSAKGETALSLLGGAGVSLLSSGRTLRAPLAARVAFSPDGALLVAAGREDGVILVLDVKSGVERASFTHADGVERIAFAASGRSFATLGRDGTVLVWATPSGS